MNKLDTIILDNGLRIYLYNDHRRHSTFFQLTTMCGGLTKDFKYNGNVYHLQDGVAHILEHYIVECNDNGNFLDDLGKKQMATNAGTSLSSTGYYFETVEDVLYGVRTILNGIYNVTFDKKKLEKLKNPIFQEIRGKFDNKFYHLNRSKISNLFNDISFRDIGGTLDEIDATKIEDLELLYNAFYRPSNQFIMIAGNFNKNEVLNEIKTFYKNFNKKYADVELLDNNEISPVRKKEEVIYFPTPMDYCDLSFKIDISNYSSEQLLDLDFYLYSFYSECFGVISPVYKKMVDEKIIIDSINVNNTKIANYMIISVGAYTNDPDTFKEYILDELNRLDCFDEEQFDLNKRTSIVGLILRDESIFKTIFPLLDNIIDFDYPYLDKVEDIEKMKYDEYVNCIKSLDFSNYCYSVIKNKA